MSYIRLVRSNSAIGSCFRKSVGLLVVVLVLVVSDVVVFKTSWTKEYDWVDVSCSSDGPLSVSPTVLDCCCSME